MNAAFSIGRSHKKASPLHPSGHLAAEVPSNGNVDGFIQRWWLVAKIMMGERAPARRIPSAAAVTGNLDQIVSPAAASTTIPICS